MPDLPLPISVLRSLQNFGVNISVARKKRRISTESMAIRAGISRSTVVKIEKGDLSVSFGNYIAVLSILGLAQRIEEVTRPEADEIGLALDEARLPKRIRTKPSIRF